MENASSPSDLWNNVTTSSSKDDARTLYLANIRYLGLKIVYIIIGTVGVLDNLFVIIVFLLFIKITDKVLAILKLFYNIQVRKVLWTRKGERATAVTAGHCTHAELTSGHSFTSCYSCCVHSCGLC